MTDADKNVNIEPVSRRRSIVYVDGYNLYYGVLSQNPKWKWLDLYKYFSVLRSDEEVILVRYFTALIEPDKRLSEKRDRQKRLLTAMGADGKVSVCLGRYQLRTVTCRAQCGLTYQTPEEKKTDVNIAVSMMEDAIDARADCFILVSGDSDMEPAVQWIRKRYPAVKIIVYIPMLPGEEKTRRNDNYLSMGVACKPLPLTDIDKFRLPHVVVLPNGQTVEQPKEWM